MMAYLALSEIHPTILRDEITYTGTTDSTSVQDIKSPVSLTPGATYTVADLIEHMIRNLDNNAVDLLMKHLKDTNNLDTYTEVYCDLGIDPKVLLTYTDNITPRQYLIFLRSLYNSTYLSRIDSEKALALMAETDFTGGISAGLPAGVKVAQKFGEVRMTDTDGNQVGKEINNCGIIYYPKHPYMLCVMTKAQGNDIAGLEETISTISRLIYTDMQKRYP
jgi:beta-lactamase class A